MSEIDEIINELNAVTLADSGGERTSCPEKIIPVIEKIIACEPKPNIYDNLDLRENFVQLLSIDNPEIKINVSKCIAEIARNEKQRMQFTKEEIIKLLLANIKQCEDQLMDLNIQTCRALGNICYSNDDARLIIKNMDGDAILIDLLNYPYDSEKDSINYFIKVRCGLISNYFLGDDVCEKAVELKVIDKIERILKMSIADVEKYEELLLNTLPPLSILTEQISDLIFSKNLNQLLIKILEVCTNPDLAEMCLVLLQYEAQNDDIKLQLAEEGLCEIIYQLLEKYKTFAKTNEARVLMKLACEIIVLILTGDKSMHYLYSTSLLKYMEEWLDSSDPDLLATGVLAIGNFARTDSHCIHMVENNVMKKLLSILSNNNGVDHDMILQHALLSALRNLVIPRPNKAAVIEAGLVATILPMLEIHQPPVVFKLLGTLRMTVDGQEKLALDLLANEKLISQLVHWSKSSDYAGVTGESFRLIAWLIKHAYQAHSSTPADVSNLIKFIGIAGSVESMINMLQSTHLVMQNEALIALTIMSAVLHQENAEENKLDAIFIECNLGQKIVDLIQRSSDNMTKEIVENLQIFVKLLKLSSKLVEHLDAHNIDKLLESIPSLTEYCTL